MCVVCTTTAGYTTFQPYPDGKHASPIQNVVSPSCKAVYDRYELGD